MPCKLLATLLLLLVLTTSRGKKHLDLRGLDLLYKPLISPTAHDRSAQVSDRGVIRSCGPPNANFSMEWEPKILSPEGNITVYYNFKFPYDIKTGILSLSLSYGSSSMVYKETQRVDCGYIGKYFPCPVKAETPFKGQYTYLDLLGLQAFEDTYSIELKLTTIDEKIIICAKATVTVDN